MQHTLRIPRLQPTATRTLNVARAERAISVERRALGLEVGVAVLGGGDVVGALDELQGEAAVDVPDDVAVHDPGAGVVGLEADDGVAWWGAGAATAGEHGGVTGDVSMMCGVEGRGAYRRAGLLKFRVLAKLGFQAELPWPRMDMSWPCKCMGWAAKNWF